MKDKDRFYLFGIGVLIGCVLVTLMIARRDAFREETSGSWIGAETASSEFPPLPDGVEPVMREGTPLFYRADEDGAAWVVGFTERYPYVRIHLDHASGEISYMAADQVVVQLPAGKDILEFAPAMDALDLRLRTFNRRNRVVIVGTVEVGVDAVPATIQALEPYAELFESAEPDWIRFRTNERRGRFF